jgi:hypothetical protein
MRAKQVSTRPMPDHTPGSSSSFFALFRRSFHRQGIDVPLCPRAYESKHRPLERGVACVPEPPPHHPPLPSRPNQKNAPYSPGRGRRRNRGGGSTPPRPPCPSVRRFSSYHQSFVRRRILRWCVVAKKISRIGSLATIVVIFLEEPRAGYPAHPRLIRPSVILSVRNPLLSFLRKIA